MMSRPCHTCVTIPGVDRQLRDSRRWQSIATTGTPLLFAWASTGVVAFGSSG